MEAAAAAADLQPATDRPTGASTVRKVGAPFMFVYRRRSTRTACHVGSAASDPHSLGARRRTHRSSPRRRRGRGSLAGALRPAGSRTEPVATHAATPGRSGPMTPAAFARIRRPRSGPKHPYPNEHATNQPHHLIDHADDSSTSQDPKLITPLHPDPLVCSGRLRRPERDLPRWSFGGVAGGRFRWCCRSPRGTRPGI